MKRIFNILIIFSGIYFLLIIIASLNGQLTFGYGLGDLFFFYLTLFWFVVLLITFLIIFVKKKNFSNIKYMILNSVLLIPVIISLLGFANNRVKLHTFNGYLFLNSSVVNEVKAINLEYKSILEELRIKKKKIQVLKKEINLDIKNKDYDNAINGYKSLILLDSNDFEIYYDFGNVYLKQNLLKDALEQYTKAKDIDSTKNNITDKIKQLNEKIK